MHDDMTEHELRSLFQKLRREEQLRVPAFEPLLRSAERRGQRAPRSVLLWVRLAGAAAVAAALVLMLGVFRPHQPQPAVDLEAWSALSQWTASTDTFLVSSGPSLGGSSFVTPSDTWMSSPIVTEGRQSTRKESL
jgi:hypothetical protein